MFTTTSMISTMTTTVIPVHRLRAPPSVPRKENNVYFGTSRNSKYAWVFSEKSIFTKFSLNKSFLDEKYIVSVKFSPSVANLPANGLDLHQFTVE